MIPVKLSALDQDVLTALLGRVLYSQELLDALNNGRPVPIKAASVYPAVLRLEAKSMVEWSWGDDESLGGRRKYYSVTKRGEIALKELIRYRDGLLSAPKQKR